MLMLSLPILALIGGVVAVLVFLGSRYWRLRHIPGPFVASLTDFWAAARIWRGDYAHAFVNDLHDKYGPVVRWGPNRVSFASSEAIPTIYGVQNVYSKAPSYSPLVILSKGEEIPTLITLRDEKRVSEIKRHVSAGFSQSTWLKQEGQMDSSLETLIARLRSEAGKVVHLHHWLKLWGTDILTLLAFSESRQYLQHGYDVDGVFPASASRFSHWRLWSALPKLEKLLFRNPLMQYFGATTSGLAKLGLNQIHQRQSEDKQAAGNDLLGRYLAASQQAPNVIRPRDVLALTISTINAGTDTVATACVSTMERLLTHPDAYARLERELASSELPVPAAFNDLDKLPFLDAVIRENLRLSLNTTCTERTISSEDIIICDTFIPAGTDVSISSMRTARDPTIFGSRAESFVPQRWLDADEKQFREMERASFHFSHGRRECIGKHLAKIEVKKCVAALVAAFKMELAEPPVRGFADGLGYVKVNVKLAPRS